MELAKAFNVFILFLLASSQCQINPRLSNSTVLQTNKTLQCAFKIYREIQDITNGYCHCNRTSENLAIICDANEYFSNPLQGLTSHRYCDVEKITLKVENPQSTPLHLDIRPLRYFAILQEFEILSKSYILRSLDIMFDNETFYGCKEIKKLRINVPLTNRNLSSMIKPLTKLEDLNLNGIRDLGFNRLCEITKINSSLARGIRTLNLRNFQTITGFGYSGSCPVQELLGRGNKYVNCKNYKNLTRLDLSYNGIQIVLVGFDDIAPNLKYLDISHNLLTNEVNFPFFAVIFRQLSIEVLKLNDQNYAYFTNVHMEQKSHLINLELHYKVAKIFQSMESEKDKMLKKKMPLSTLKCVDVITRGNVSAIFTNNVGLLRTVIRMCLHYKLPIFEWRYSPKLYDMLDFDCQYWIKFPLAPNTHTLELSNINAYPILNNMSYMYGNSLCIANNSLRKLYINDNKLWWKDFPKLLSDVMNNQVSLRGLDHLEEVDLSNNDVTLNIEPSKISFPSLRILNLSRNANVNTGPNTSFCRDKGLHNLTVIDISGSLKGNKNSSFLRFIENCQNLQELHLSNNELNSTFSISLTGVSKLKLLDLSNNKLEVINQEFSLILNTAASAKNLTVDLSNNPLTCDCSRHSLAFIKWATKSRKIKIQNFHELQCSGQDGLFHLSRIDFHAQWYRCNHVTTITSTVVTSLFVALIIGFLIFTYRWRFRLQYICIKLAQRCGLENNENPDEENEEITNYEYDAFVSYSSEDRFWVHDVLMKTLEETYGFKLVIHYRDVRLGENVGKAIDDLINKSREFILVLSENFFESNWCMEEMEETYRQSLIRHSKIAVIILGEMPRNIQNPTARHILRTYNYLEWNVNETEGQDIANVKQQKLFWSKLVQHLYGDGRRCCCLGPSAIRYRDVQVFANHENQGYVQDEQQENEIDSDTNYGGLRQSTDECVKLELVQSPTFVHANYEETNETFNF